MAGRSSGQKTEGVWQIHRERVRAKLRANKPRSVEDLHYNNPYRYKIERVWFDGRVVFATEQGEVDVDPKKVKVAQEYQIVYAVKLTARRKLARGAGPKRVVGQSRRTTSRTPFAPSATVFAAVMRSGRASSSRLS